MKNKAGKAKNGHSSIAWLLLFFNVLLIFVPIASFLSLESYERSLLDSLEHALAQQGRFLAAWLSVSRLDEEGAARAVRALGGEHTARIRVVDEAGRLLADSSRPEPERIPDAREENEAQWRAKPQEESARESWIYEIFSLPVRAARKYFMPPQPNLESADYYGAAPGALLGDEIKAALGGRYGAATRISSGGQVSVTLYSAVPIRSPDGERVSGAVLASQSTYRILLEIYELRVQVARIFLYSLTAALALTLILSFFVLRPVRRLSRQAREALTPFGLRDTPFPSLRRGDEIGELSQALSEFSQRLKERLDWAERFSQDAAHELRNPIASVRAAAELLEGADEAERRRIRATIAEEAHRMARIVDGLRRLSRLDSDPGAASEVRLDEILGNAVAARAKEGSPRVELSVEHAAKGAKVLIDPDRLVIALDTLLDNAVSFTPPSGKVRVGLERSGGFLVVSVEDEGPGILPENMDKIFKRFFSYRPEENGGGNHAGLGLSIAQAVASGSGGSVEAKNRPEGGARFAFSLPEAKKP